MINRKKPLYNVISILRSLLQVDFLPVGMLFLLLSLGIALIAYYTHISSFYFISFYMILFSLLLLFIQMGHDIRMETNSWIFPVILLPSILLLYFSQRMELHRFDFFIADASDYYLAGINSVIRGGDMGFFLPMTSAISALGFTFGGYEYGPMIIVIIYVSAIPLGYFLFRSLNINALLSYSMVIFIISSPLSIWFSKSTYSESIWQIEILLLSMLSYIILTNKKIAIKTLVSFYLLMSIVPFTRGEASLLYGIIIFLSIFHLWRYKHLKMALLIAISTIFLAVSIHYSLGLRSHYLLKWQYARIISDITEAQLMSILYGVSFLIFALLVLLKKVQKYFSTLNMFFIITLMSIVAKVSLAYIYHLKKGAVAHTLLFKNALGFNNFLILNELGFAYDSFGLIITFFIIIGLIILHIKALKGNISSLLLVVIYSIFTLPFVMQCVNTNDIHEIFLYWGRYYFSILMIIHIFALGLVLQFIFNFIKKIMPNKVTHYTFLLVFLFSVIYLSMDTKLYKIVTQESYLKNSQKLMPWVKTHVGTQSLSIIYDKDIKYELHHNRVYDAKILTYRTFPVANINIKHYQKIDLNTTLLLEPEILKNKFLLSITEKPFKFKKKGFTEISSIILPISWREHYGIRATDKNLHQGKLAQSIKHNLKLYATLYRITSQKIEEKFVYGKEIIFNKTSQLSREILKKNWYYTKNDKGAWAINKKAVLNIPHIKKVSDVNYRLVFKYFVFDASTKYPKKVKVSLDGTVLKELHIEKSSMQLFELNIPNILLMSKVNNIILDIDVMGKTPEKGKSPYSIYLESLKIIKSKI